MLNYYIFRVNGQCFFLAIRLSRKQLFYYASVVCYRVGYAGDLQQEDESTDGNIFLLGDSAQFEVLCLCFHLSVR